MNYSARLRLYDGKEQSIQDHLKNTADLCGGSLECIGLGSLAYVTGLIHDLGKFSDEFGRYLRSGDKAARGSVNHSSAGAMYIYNEYYVRAYEKKDLYMAMAAQMVIDAVYCHHSRLFDCIDPETENVFLKKMESKADLDYRPLTEEFFKTVISEAEFDELFRRACGELKTVTGKFRHNECFGVGMLQKLLYSALIDADRYDAYCFEAGKDMEHEEADWESMRANLKKRLDSLSGEGDVNTARSYISDSCEKAAGRGKGVYRLSVPTGAGKTLASLRYALNCPDDKKHIYYVIPYTTILDQTAAEVTAICGDDNVVVHHSGIVVEDDNILHQLFTERWTAPVVLTTLVQFMNSIYAGKPACMRRFRALCDSVIIFDEVQAMPEKIISLFNEAVNFLTEVCGCTVLLCTATQPAFDSVKDHPLSLAEQCDIVTLNDETCSSAFKRVKAVNMSDREMSLEEIAEFAESQLEIKDSVLVIMNTVAEANNVYRSLSGDERKFLLTTKKCAAHRKKAIAEIKKHIEELRRGERKDKLIVVSTQLVEAGVDLSFECVIRALAGLDNFIQSIGRCNRNGEFNRLCEGYLVNVKDEDLSCLEEIDHAKKCAKRVMRLFGDDFLSEAAMREYYRQLLKQKETELNKTEFIVEKTTIMEMLSENRRFLTNENAVKRPKLCQAFETAGMKFNVIDNIGYTVIVPYEKGADHIRALRSAESITEKADILKRCREYSVTLYEYECKKLSEMNALSKLEDPGVWILEEGFYDDEYGVRFDGEPEFMNF